MSAQRLYMAVHVDRAGDHYLSLANWEVELLTAIPEPDGWREYALDRWPDGPREGEHWPNGHKPFFYPKTGVPYRSRSTAQRRVDMINYWGGNAEVLECTPVWESVAAANLRRERARIEVRIEKKHRELEALKERLYSDITAAGEIAV